MALSALLRRAHSSAILPLSSRAVLSATCKAESGGSTLQSSSLEQLLMFSTATVKKKKGSRGNETLIRVIDSEIKSALASELHDCVIEAPDGFPFRVHDRVGQRIVALERKYEEESIRIQVDLSNAGYEEDGSEDSSFVNSAGEHESQPSVPVVITISKGKGSCLQFDARAFPDRISIHGLSIKDIQHPESHLDYRGPAFSKLDEKMQVAFHKYLEIRGITTGTAKFLLEYIICKDTKEYSRWLKYLKNFFRN